MTKKMLVVGTAFALIVGIIVYKNNIVADDWWNPLNPVKNAPGYIEGFKAITGDTGSGQQTLIRCTLKNQNSNYLDIHAYTVEYEPTSTGPLSEKPSQWISDVVIPYGQEDVKAIPSGLCFKMPVHMTIGGITHDGKRIKKIDRVYGKEINKCVNKNVTITLQGSRPGYGTAEPGVLIELGSADNKILTYEEYFYDIEGQLKWHKENGELR